MKDPPRVSADDDLRQRALKENMARKEKNVTAVVSLLLGPGSEEKLKKTPRTAGNRREGPSGLRSVDRLGRENKSERKKEVERNMGQMPLRRQKSMAKGSDVDALRMEKEDQNPLRMQMAVNIIQAPQMMEREAAKKVSMKIMYNGTPASAFDLSRGEWKLNHSRLAKKDQVPEHSTAWERMKARGKAPADFIAEEKEMLKRRAIEANFDNAEEARLFLRFQSAITKPVGTRKNSDASCIRDHLRVINAYMRDFVPMETMLELSLNHFRSRRLKKLTHLYREGEWPEGCFILISGSAYIEMSDKRVQRRKLVIGEMICDMDLAQNRQTTNNVICYDKCMFCLIPKDSYYKYMNAFRRNLAIHSALTFFPSIGPFIDCTQRELRELAYCMGIMSIREKEKLNLSVDSRLFLVMEGCIKVKVVAKRRKQGTGTNSVAQGFKSVGRDLSFLNGYFDKDTVDVCRPGGVMGLYNTVGNQAENKKLPAIMAEAATDCVLFYISTKDLIDYAPERCIAKLENELKYRKALYMSIYERVNEDRLERELQESRQSTIALKGSKTGAGGVGGDDAGASWAGPVGADPESAREQLSFPKLYGKDGKPLDPVRYSRVEKGILHTAEGHDQKDPLLSFGRNGGNPGAGRARAHPSFNFAVGRNHGKPPDAATQTMTPAEIGFAKACKHLKFKVNDLGQITIQDHAQALDDIERDASIKQTMRKKLAELVDGECRSVDHITGQSNSLKWRANNSGNTYYMDELAGEILNSQRPTTFLHDVKTFRPEYTKTILETLDEEQFDTADDLDNYLSRTELAHLSTSPRKVGVKQSVARKVPFREIGFSSTFTHGKASDVGAKDLTPRAPVGFDAGGRRTNDPLKPVYERKYLGAKTLAMEAESESEDETLRDARYCSPTGLRMPPAIRRTSPRPHRRTYKVDADVDVVTESESSESDFD